MKENKGPAVNEAGSLHGAIMLRASSFVLSCEREMCMHSPYSMQFCGGSQKVKQLNF